MRAWDAANYKGWQRFFLVPGGHIHASTGCHSLRITTLISWLPELSGETEAEAVAEHGACCAPSASPRRQSSGRSARSTRASATGAPDMDRRRGRYAPCRECGYVGHITRHGNLRKHKRQAPEAAA